MLTKTVHPIDPSDVAPAAAQRAGAAPRKGVRLGPEARPMFDAMRGATPRAQGVRIEPGEAGGVSGLWCRVSDGATRARMLFLHGGGYMMGSAAATAGFASQLAVRSGADTFVADYRLAPEHPFPAAFDDALAAYDGLAVVGGRVAIAGESAGGGLALAVLGALAGRADAREPVAAAVMSPWADLTLGGASYRDRAEADPIFTRHALAGLADIYLQGADPTDPRASPLGGPTLRVPLRIDVGDNEVLLNDATDYARRAADAGAPVALHFWDGMAHVFQAEIGTFAAAARCFDEVGAFLAAHLADASGHRAGG